MSALCFTGDGIAASLFASALHLAWTGEDGVAREESWHARHGRFELFAARSLEAGEWRHAWPPRPAQPRLVLDRWGLRADYVVCGEGWCMPLERIAPRRRAPVVTISPC